MRAPAIGERWETRRLLAILTAIAVVASMVGLYSGTARADHPGNTNDASYWAAHYQEHKAECFKHDPPGAPNAHGFLSDGGLSVTLNPFDPAWPGDHWEVLIVKAGSNDIGFGPGNAVYEHPDAGVAYFPPPNAAGGQPAVSHWIVCKGTTPPPTTTTTLPTTTTTEATTTTTQATTTTTQATTTTSVEDTTTSTQATTTTSIEDEVLPTVVTTAPEVDPDDELPFTGLDTDVMIGLSILFLGLGAGLLTLTRKLEEN